MPLKQWNDLLTEAGDSATFEVLPAGDYDLKVDKSEATMSSNGKLMFKLTHVVQSGPYKGRRLWSNLVVSHDNQTALGIFFRQMGALGISREYFATNPSDAQVADALLGREFRGQVAIKPYQGVDRNEIKAYHPARSAEASPTPPAPPVVPAAVNAPSAPAQPPIAPAAPLAPPVAAAAAEPAPAPATTPAPEPVVQAATPPVPDEYVAPAVPPAEAAAPTAPASPF